MNLIGWNARNGDKETYIMRALPDAPELNEPNKGIFKIALSLSIRIVTLARRLW